MLWTLETLHHERQVATLKVHNITRRDEPNSKADADKFLLVMIIVLGYDMRMAGFKILGVISHADDLQVIEHPVVFKIVANRPFHPGWA